MDVTLSEKGSKRCQHFTYGIWKLHRILYLSSNFNAVFCELIAQRACGSVLTYFLYLLRFCRYNQPKGANKSRIQKFGISYLKL
jgi:hypothetical protein